MAVLCNLYTVKGNGVRKRASLHSACFARCVHGRVHTACIGCDTAGCAAVGERPRLACGGRGRFVAFAVAGAVCFFVSFFFSAGGGGVFFFFSALDGGAGGGGAGGGCRLQSTLQAADATRARSTWRSSCTMR